MGVKNYSADEVSIIFAGIPVTGIADGEFVSVAMNNPAWSMMIGADGEGVRARSNDESGTVTITLLQSSETNDAFSAIHALDKKTKKGAKPFMLKDVNGTTVVSAQTAWIEKVTDVGYGKDAGNRQWVLKTDRLNVHAGGNELA